LLLLGDQLENIPGLRNMREVDLGLNLLFAAEWTRRASGRLRFGVRTEMRAHLVRFMVFE
jgi:hypothetical protein